MAQIWTVLSHLAANLRSPGVMNCLAKTTDRIDYFIVIVMSCTTD